MISRRAFVSAVLGAVLVVSESAFADRIRRIFPTRRWLVYHGIRSERPSSYWEGRPGVLVSGVVLLDRGNRTLQLTARDIDRIDRILGDGVFNWTVTRGHRPTMAEVSAMPLVPSALGQPRDRFAA